MARIKDSSVRDVVAAADMVEVVAGRTQLRRASGSRFTGRCPFHEEKTPSFSVNPVEKLYYCFGCGKGGDIISFVRETENLDFVGAVEWLAERFRVPIEVEEASPRVEEARRRRERLYAVLDQTATYFERLLWDGDGAAPVREYLAGRGLGEEIAKEFRLGLSPGKGLADKARERGFTLDELKSAGLVTTRGSDYFPQRLMFPLADARGRVVGFQARKLREDDPLERQVRELARRRSLPQERRSLRAPSREGRDRQAGLRRSRRGEHRRDRAASGRLRTGRGVDGYGAHCATAARAGPNDQEAVPLLRRRCRRPGGDVARDGARSGAGLRRQDRHASPWPGPCRRARRVRRPAAKRGELSRLPRAPRDRALGRSTGRVRAGARGAGEGGGLARAAGGTTPAR